MNTSFGTESTPHLEEYLRIVRRHIWSIISIFIAIVSITAFWNFSATPIYRATVKILVESKTPKVVSFEEVVGQNLQNREYFQTQKNLLQTRSVAKRVVKNLGLAKREGFGIPFKKESDPIKSLLGTAVNFIRELVEKEHGKKQKISAPNLNTLEQVAIDAVLSRLTVSSVINTRLLHVNVEDTNPATAAKIANVLVKHFITLSMDLRFSATKDATVWLQREIDKSRKTLLNAEDRLQEYKEKANIVSLEGHSNIIAQKLSQLNSKVTEIRTDRMAQEILALRVKNSKGDLKKISSLPDVIESTIVQKLKSDHVDMLRKRSELSKRYKMEHPRIKRISSQLALIKKKLDDEIIGVAESIVTKYQLALSREKSLQNSLEKQKKTILQLNRMSIKYNSLKREAETNRLLYEEMLKRAKETSLMEKLDSSNIRVVEHAEIPKFAAKPMIARNISISAGIALFLGVAFSFFLDNLDKTIRSPRVVEEIMGSPILGGISQMKLTNQSDSKYMAQYFDQRGIVKDQFREIRTMAFFRLAPNHKIIQVTSCIPEEGKTFISFNLSCSIADSGKNVLLIDGDIYKQSIQSLIYIPSKYGLTNVLSGELEADDAIISVPDSNLHFLSSGRFDSTSTQLIESDRIKKLFDHLKHSYDYIIVDTPPLLVVSDPLTWASAVDSVLFVVNIQDTTRTMLEHSKHKLIETNAPIVGAILNRIKKNNDYYAYGYNKKYSYYYQSGT